MQRLYLVMPMFQPSQHRIQGMGLQTRAKLSLMASFHHGLLAERDELRKQHLLRNHLGC